MLNKRIGCNFLSEFKREWKFHFHHITITRGDSVLELHTSQFFGSPLVQKSDHRH